MHHCPDCGQACYCHGDIDDCEVETLEYSSQHCTCAMSEDGCGADREDDGGFIDDPPEENPCEKPPAPRDGGEGAPAP